MGELAYIVRSTDSKKRRNSIDWFEKILNPDGDYLPCKNVAEYLSKDELDRIGQRCLVEFQTDEDSRVEWQKQNDEAMKLANQIIEPKTDPWPGAASIKLPLVTVASIMFGARAYPAIITDRGVVRCTVVGRDPDGMKASRAARISEHMSWQLLDEMKGWEDELDRLLMVLPVTGMVFKKTYFDSREKVNRSDLVLPEDVVFHRKTRSMHKVRRITHKFIEYANDIHEYVASGLWLDVKFPNAESTDHPGDEDAPHEFLEQHRFLDIDGDGYEEPYIVTLHKKMGNVVRIVPRFEAKDVIINGTKVVRIEPTQYFTLFSFIPNPDGTVYSNGFGALLYPINAAANSVLNQLIDSGTLHNLQAGWIDRMVREKGGNIPFRPGEWRKTETKNVDLKSKIYPLPTKEPSSVLFSVLGLLMETGKEVGQIKDVLMGKLPGQNTPATTVLAAIEQGTKEFSAIYKRVFRSLGEEYRKLYRLNSIYLDQELYFRVLDDERVMQIGLEDYQTDDFDVIPLSDPTMVSDVQRMAKAQSIVQTLQGRPGVNEDAITVRLLEALQVRDPQELIIPPDQREQGPPPELQIELERVAVERSRVDLQAIELEASFAEMAAKITKMEADAVKSLAQAEAAEVGPQLQLYLQEMRGMYETAKARLGASRQGQGGTQGGQTGNGGSPTVEAGTGQQGVAVPSGVGEIPGGA